MSNLLKNKWALFIGGGIILFIIIVVISSGNETRSPSETSQPLSTQKEQSKEQIQPLPDRIKTLVDFENSQFCKKYKCKETDSWTLRSGGINHFYHIPLGGDKYNYITVEVTIENKQATVFGLMYYDRELSGLKPGDLEIAYKLLNSIDSTQNMDSVKDYIAENIEKTVSQINQAQSFSWGSFDIYAGKIGQQTINIEKTIE